MPLTLTGNGTLAVGAGTNAIAITSGNLVNLPVQPSFFVTQGSTSYQNTTITYGTVISNVGSYYSTGTGRFTAPVAGNYFFFAQGYANGGAMDLSIRLNNSGINAGRSQNASTNHISIILTLAANDYVTVYTSGSPSYSDGSNWSYFGGYLVG